MEVIKKDRMLKFNPNTLQEVRKEYNLDQTERMDEAINILEDWVKKQDHFVKKDFPRCYLERTLISTKGLVERAKLRLDKLCTFRTIMSNFFKNNDLKVLHESLLPIIEHGHLTQLTKDNYRVYMFNIISDDIDPAKMLNYYKYLIGLCEYIKRNDYCKGFILICDFSHINVIDLVTMVNPVELRQTMLLLTEGYGMQIKGIHVITPSKMVDALLTLLKQVLSEKVAGRIHVHKTVESLYSHVDKEILPKEYGGNEMCLRKLNEAWFEIISSKDHMEYLQQMNGACTDESCRKTEKFHEQYLGMPGSFRTLSVD